MNRELFVSTTPHETKVGLVEDDLLAEIYLERENEYTLAGSIYKGRVTRVLPGMQSAFVDIGLERDAFLYVSDFMDLEQHDEDLDTPVPVKSAPEPRQQEPRVFETRAPRAEMRSAAPPAEDTQGDEGTEASGGQGSSGEQFASTGNGGRGGREGRGFRGRRRRGRRDDRSDRTERSDRGERRPAEPLAAAPASIPPPMTARPSRASSEEYGPPAGYEPMLLPGESISKYRGVAKTIAPPAVSQADAAVTEVPQHELVHSEVPPTQATFASQEPEWKGWHAEPEEAHAEIAEPSVVWARNDTLDLEEEPETHVEPEAVAADEEHQPSHQHSHEPSDELATDVHAEPAHATVEAEHNAEPEPHQEPSDDQHHRLHGAVVNEEIEEEEADLAAYVEDLEEDATFEEMEEETSAANEFGQTRRSVFAADTTGAAHEEHETLLGIEAEGAEEDERDDLDLDEAQAEAEALMASGGAVHPADDTNSDGRVSPVGDPQREQQSETDRRRGRRGGRRFTRKRENTVIPQISDLLKEGQEILVQIAKEPIGKKGARITSHIALPGRFLVYMPTVNHTGVSRKIASEEERQRLKRIIQSERENGHGGFIVRTAASGCSEDELRADIRFLKNLWNEIKGRADSNKAPALIYHDLNVVERVLRDQVTSDFSVIWVDTEQEYERILRFANRFQPALVRRVKLYTKETPLYEQFGLSEEINKALKSKVWLKSGGYIVINQTEALVAIDVNTGKYVGKTTRLEDTIVKTNVDAIKEIVRQIRLRDLGGIIVIDFIDMDERRNRQKVMQALEEALRNDRAPSKVLQFNDFGLVAITRKRVKQSLERTIGSPCPYCESTGFVKSVTTVCNDIYVEVRKVAKHLQNPDVMLRVNPEVAKTLKNNNAKLLIEMEELLGRSIIVKSDPALHQEQFDVN